MQNNPTRHQPPSTHGKNNLGTTKPGQKGNGNTKGRGSFAGFLIDTDVKPFVVVGKCMQFFGLGVVVSFLLGAGCLYTYAVFEHLPGSKQATVAPPQQLATASPSAPKQVWLHGTVKSHETPFEIGVLATRQGPFQPDGSYSIQVPESDRYLVIGWYQGYENFKLQEMSADASGTLQQLVFPTLDMTSREGSLNKQRNRAAGDYDLALNRKSQTRDGGFNLRSSLQGGSK